MREYQNEHLKIDYMKLRKKYKKPIMSLKLCYRNHETKLQLQCQKAWTAAPVDSPVVRVD